MAQSDFVKRMNLGPSTLKLQMAREVLLKRPVELPKSLSRPLLAPSSVTSSEVTPVEQETSSIESASPEVKDDVRARYKDELRARIEKNKSYPPISRRLGQSGTVIIAFTLLEDGHIINIRIDTPSRYEALNQSALDAVRGVHGFKPIPKELGETQMDIKVPLKFVTI